MLTHISLQAVSQLRIDRNVDIKFEIKGKNAQQISELRMNCFVFKDSVAFQADSLDNLCKRHLKNGGELSLLKTHALCKDIYGKFSDRKYELLSTGKQVFCFDYLDSPEKLNETQLPPRDKFFNKLKNESVSEEDYVHAQAVFSEFKCGTLAEYLTIYLIMDVIILQELMDHFSVLAGKNFGLFPEHYQSLPGLAFDAAKLLTGVSIELPQDLAQVEFFEQGLRGGFTNTFQKYFATAQDYEDLSEAQKKQFPFQEYQDMCEYYGGYPELVYVDANNLYGHVQLMDLPHTDFKWLPKQQLKAFEKTLLGGTLPKISSSFSKKKGFICEADIFLPKHLHHKFDGFPLCPEIRKVDPSEFSDGQMFQYRTVLPKLSKDAPDSGQKKLVADLHVKRNYILHHRFNN